MLMSAFLFRYVRVYFLLLYFNGGTQPIRFFRKHFDVKSNLDVAIFVTFSSDECGSCERKALEKMWYFYKLNVPGAL